MEFVIFFMNHRFLMRVVFAVLFIVSMYLVIWGLYQSHTLRSVYEKTKHKIEKDLATRVYNRYVIDYIHSPYVKWLDDTFKYARLYDKQKRIQTSFQYFIFACGLSSLIFFLAVMKSNQMLLVLVAPILTFVLCYFVLFLMRIANRRSVNNDLVAFLNLLGNYSTGNTEITSVFLLIAPKMHNPLRTCLVECVAESQNTTDGGREALQNLQRKIESPKFREIIKGLMISQEYSGSFVDVVVNNRISLGTFVKAQKMQKNMAQQNTISMTVCVGAIFLIMVVLGKMVETNIIMELFTTAVGNIVFIIMVACILYFIKKTLEASV